MTSAVTVAPAPLLAAVVRTADCGRYSSDGGSAECEHRVDVGVGATVVVVVVLLAVGYVGWRVLLHRLGSRTPRDSEDPGDVD